MGVQLVVRLLLPDGRDLSTLMCDEGYATWVNSCENEAFLEGGGEGHTGHGAQRLCSKLLSLQERLVSDVWY